MKINQYEFLRDGKPFEPNREEIIQFTEHELAEKDKEIEEFRNCRDRLAYTIDTYIFGTHDTEQCKKEFEYQIRHQVCQEIKDKSGLNIGYIGKPGDEIYYTISQKVLDKIEKGEKDD